MSIQAQYIRVVTYTIMPYMAEGVIMNTNTMGSKIIDNRYIGKVQLNADDMGGVGCSTWEQYVKLCDNIVVESWKRLHGKGVDANALGLSVTGLFSLFGVDAKPTPEYQHRLMVAVINRKAQRSDKLKSATKAKSEAKKVYEQALADGKDDETLATLKADLDEKTKALEALYLETGNYWFELQPMLDNTRKHASANARKAIEDTVADIIAERDLMTIEELQAEAQRLADERKGRMLRKREEAKTAQQAKDAATI